MKSYYFTFGFGQPGYPGYVKVIADNEENARKIMFDRYKNKWGMCYNSYDKMHPSDAVYERDSLP